MSHRTVVRVEQLYSKNGPMLQVSLDETDSDVPDDVSPLPTPMNCNASGMPPWTDPDAVSSYGRVLLERLCTQSAVGAVLKNDLSIEPDDMRFVYFYLNGTEAELMCWETLCTSTGVFLALDRRWPIGRIPHSFKNHPSPPFPFAAPVRILALLSAAQIPAESEWLRLRDAVVQAEKKAGDRLSCTLRVLVSEEDLRAKIEEEIANGLGGVEVAPMPDRWDNLESSIAQFRPNVLHLFCHGDIAVGSARLHFATTTDWDNPDARNGSLMVTIEQLMNARKFLTELWLATLNCCEGAKAGSQFHSMAQRLVTRARFPAVVAMVEPVDVADANEFTQSFYPALLEKLKQSVANLAVGTKVDFHWPDLLHGARAAISESHDNNPMVNRQWTLPVVYVQNDQFSFLRVDDEFDEMKQLAEHIAGVLRAWPPSTPDEVRDNFLAKFSDLPPEMLPNRHGDFGGSK